MTSKRFKLLFAWRNITSDKKNSLVVILTLSLVFTLLLMLLGMNFSLSKIYEFESANIYQDIDIVMTYDEYSSSRLINKRYLTDEYSMDIRYSLSFFNLDVLIEDDSPYYAKLMSALPHEFELLVDMDVNTFQNQMIITESFAKEYGLMIGDTVSFSVFDKTYEYEVGDIFKDTGLFSGITFYIDKEKLFEDAYGLGTLTNFGNEIYIYTFEETTISTLIADLKMDEHFQDYHIFPTFDQEYITEKANDTSSMMLALGLIVLIAILMVLDSLFPIVNKEIRQQLGITETLGADSRFLWHVNLRQWMIYTLISFVLAYGITLFSINYGTKVYGYVGFIPIKLTTTLLALAIVLIFVIFRAKLGFSKEEKLSLAAKSYDKTYLRYKLKYWLMILSGVVLIVEMIFGFLPLGYKGLIISISSLYLAMTLASLVLIYLSKLLAKFGKMSVFKIFQLKYLQTNKHIHQSLKVIMISLMALVLIFSVRVFMFGEVDNFYKAMGFDLAVVNIYDYDDSLNEDIADFAVTSNDPAVFYHNIVIHLADGEVETSRFFISMNYESVDKYFNMDFENSYYTNSQISADEPYALLPINFQLVYGLEVGDVIYLDLNYKLENIEMTIGGFINTSFDNIVYSNIFEVEGYSLEAKPNSIFINTDDKDNTFDDLVRDYSDNMYYIMDPELYFADTVASVMNLTDYFTVFTLFMIICFVIIIFNNTILVFYGLRNDLAKIKVLGAKDSTFIANLAKEYLVVLSIVFLIGLGEILILSEHLKYVVLLTNYYKNISSTPLTIINSCAIVSIVLICSYLYYFYNIKKIKVVNEIKIY